MSLPITHLAISEKKFNGKSYIIGIDPGLTGGISIYCGLEKKIVDTIRMPTRQKGYSKSGKAKNEISPELIAKFLIKHEKRYCQAVIEKVGPAPRQGVVSVFNFGYGAGILAGIMAAMQIPTYLVSPAVWKALYNLTFDKDLCRIHAQNLFPEHAHKFKGKQDDGVAESALIAKYGERIYLGEHLAEESIENSIFS